MEAVNWRSIRAVAGPFRFVVLALVLFVTVSGHVAPAVGSVPLIVADPNAAVDSFGHLVLVDASGKQSVLSSNARSTAAGGPALFQYARDVGTTPAGDIYVLSAGGTGRVVRVDAATGAHSELSSNAKSQAAGGPAAFDEPEGITVGAAGEIYVTDPFASSTGTVIRVDPATGRQTVVASNAISAGQGSEQLFAQPQDTALLPGGELAVVDPLADRIVAVDASGKQTVLSSNNASQAAGGEGAFEAPYGITRGPDGTLYVADFAGAIIKVEPAQGKQTTLASVAAQGIKPGRIEYGSDGLLYFSDNAFGATPAIYSVNPAGGAVTAVSTNAISAAAGGAQALVRPFGIAAAPPQDGGGGGGGGGVPVVTADAVPRPPVQPSFVDSTAVKLKRAVWMSGAVSQVPAGVAIERYRWDFNSDGRFDAECGGSTPAVSRPFSSAGTKNVTLMTVDSLNRTALVQQSVTVAPAQVNRTTTAMFTCEDPIGVNQPDRRDCVKTFSFSIVEVNSRSSRDECFRLESRVKDVLKAAASQAADLLRVDYLAKIAGPVALNGIPIPVPEGRLTEYDSGKSTLSIGNFGMRILLPVGPSVSLPDVPAQIVVEPKKGRFAFPPLKTGGVAIAKFGGLKLGGGVEIALVNRKAEITISLKLPDFFNFGFKREAAADLVLRTSNVGGFEFGGASIDIPQVYLGPALVTDLLFKYRRNADGSQLLQGGASLQLSEVSPVKLLASPPPLGFGLRDGGFDYAGAAVEFPIPPRPQIFPGVGLFKVGGAFGIKPLRATGIMGIDAAGLVVIDGSAFIGLASEEQPFEFPPEFAPPGLSFLAGRTLDTIGIAIGGEAKIKVPVVGEVPLINSYLYYAFPDYVEFGGGFKFSLAEKFSVNGNVGGFLAIGARKFNLEGKLEGCADIEVTKFCLKADAVVSTKGIAFCTIVPVPTPLTGAPVPVPAGIGYTWGAGEPDIKVFSCDIGPYKDAVTARGAQAARGFTIAGDLPSAMVRIRGQGGVPRVTLTSPRGQKVSVGGERVGALSKDVVAIPQTPRNTLLVGLRRPAAGRWTVTADAGSVPLVAVATADGLAAPRIRATVTRRGARRILRYDVGQVDGQIVRFAERGARTWRLLGDAKGDRGEIAFTPGAGRAGRRQIVAQVERGGVPLPARVVARYETGRLARPARPALVRATRRRSGLAISWARVAGAQRYAVTVRLTNRRQVFRVVARPRLTLAGIHPRARGTVLVRAIGRDGRDGRETRTTIPR